MVRPVAEFCDDVVTCERCGREGIRGRIVPVDPMAIEGKQKPAPGSHVHQCVCGWRKVLPPSGGNGGSEGSGG